MFGIIKQPLLYVKNRIKIQISKCDGGNNHQSPININLIEQGENNDLRVLWDKLELAGSLRGVWNYQTATLNCNKNKFKSK